MKKRMLTRLKFEFEDMKKYPQFKLEMDKNQVNIWYVTFKGAEKPFTKMKFLN